MDEQTTREQLIDKQLKTAGWIKKYIKGMVSKSKFGSIYLPLPPIELQNKFASIVKEVEAMKENQKQSKNQIDNLFNALMQKAFKGELTT